MTRPTLLRRAVLLALAATLLFAVPAAAHPFIQGGEVPVDSLAGLVLDLAHGCQADDDGHAHGEGEEEPTTEVALEVPEGMRVVEVPEVEGFEVDTEVGDDGEVEVVTWSATTATEPAPQLPFDAVISGEPGDEVYLKVFQGCGDLSYRWVGTPDEPADDPAVRLSLTDPDPDSPPPDPAAAGAEEPTGDAEEPADTASEGAPDEEPAEETAPDEEAGDEDAEPAPIAAPSDPENSPLLWAVVALAGAALLIALLLALRPRPAAAPAPDAGARDGRADDTEPGGQGST